MNKVVRFFLLVFSVIGGSLLYGYYALGIFSPYNYWTAKSDINNEKIGIIIYGELSQNFKEESIIAGHYGFEIIRPGCELSPAVINGIAHYNEEMYEYLENINGKGWRKEYEIEVADLDNQNIDNKTNNSPDLDCVFDFQNQNDEFMKEFDEFEEYIWDKDTKTATIILDNNDTLKLVRGGCNHYYYSTMLITYKSDSLDLNNKNYVFNYAIELIQKTSPKQDIDLILELIANNLYGSEIGTKQHYYQFEQDNYCDMTLFINELNEFIKFEFSYYLC